MYKWILALPLAITLLAPGLASAEKMGALQIDVAAGVDNAIRDSIRDATKRAGSSGKWRWVDEKAMRAAIPAAARDCFTSDCLKEAGRATGADGGMRVRLTGESQIFDWTIDVYDLHSGKLASTQKGACELCGTAEVRSEFEATARAAVASASISAPAVAAQPKVTPKPPVEDTPEPVVAKPEPVVEPPTQSDDLPPLNNADPMAGLVMVEIIATPDDTIISMGGQEIGRGSVTVSVEQGSYQIQFAREGYGGLIETLVVGPETSQKALMRVHLAKTDPDAVMVAGEGPIDRLGPLRKTYGIVGVASGGALLLTGIWLNAIDGRPTCKDDPANCPRLRETSAAAFATTLTGAFLLTSGAVFLAWDVLSGRAESAPTAARVVPMVGENTAGVGIIGRF